MAKKLLSNITSVVNDRVDSIVLNDPNVSSIVTLVDASIKGFTPTGSGVDLSDSLKNYDAVAVEAAAYAPDSHFYLNTAYIPKPIYGGLTELGMTYRSYLLDVFCGDTVVKRIGLGFTSDLRANIWAGQDFGSNTDKLGIRNIYGIKYKTPSLPVYSTDETPVAVWVDGKTVYRKIIDLGVMSLPTGLTTIPHNISDIDMLINFEVTYRRIDSLENMGKFPYIGHNSSTNAIMYSFAQATPTDIRITTNIERPNYKMVALIEYTKR